MEHLWTDNCNFGKYLEALSINYDLVKYLKILTIMIDIIDFVENIWNGVAINQ